MSTEDLRARIEVLADTYSNRADAFDGTEIGDTYAAVARKISDTLAATDPAPDEALVSVRRAVAVRLMQEFERKNASTKPDVFITDTWLFAADVALDVLAARPTREEFRAAVERILIDRASLDEHIEEFFDEVLDDIVEAHVAHPTLAAPTPPTVAPSDLPVATGYAGGESEADVVRGRSDDPVVVQRRLSEILDAMAANPKTARHAADIRAHQADVARRHWLLETLERAAEEWDAKPEWTKPVVNAPYYAQRADQKPVHYYGPPLFTACGERRETARWSDRLEDVTCPTCPNDLDINRAKS